MLDAIGVESLEDLFADIPRGGAADPPARSPRWHVRAGGVRPPGRAGGAQPPCRRGGHVPRRGHVRPLRAGAGRLDHPALRVPDALHALPAGDLPGRAAGDVRVPDRHLRAHGAAGLERVGVRGAERRGRGRLHGQARDRKDEARDEPGPSPALPRRARLARRRLPDGDRRGPADRRGRHRRRGARRRRRRRHRRGVRAAAELPGDGRGPGRAERESEGDRRAARVRRRPAAAGHPRAARLVRRRHLRRGGPDAGQPARLRRPQLRLLRRRRALHPPHAGAHRRRDQGRGRQARLRAHPPDARAAHPPREGHAQHLHRPGAERAGRARSTSPGSASRAWSSSPR